MNILQISTPFLPVREDLHYGGTERVVYAIDKMLQQRGHQTSVAAPATSKPAGKLLPTITKHIFALNEKGGCISPHIPFHG
ncbi:MAG: hypothetical protein V1743_08060, partial [Nanoarchaeota archaeon]